MDSTPSIWLARGAARDEAVHLQLVNIIDDHSRLLVGGGFTEKLDLAALLSLLSPAIAQYGCPETLFVDRAKIHLARILVDGLPRLGGKVVPGTTGHAPGHGKIEALHQKVQNTLEEDFQLSPVSTVEDANRYYEIWRERYNVTGLPLQPDIVYVYPGLP